MTNKRRLPFLAFALVAATHAAPQYEANPICLSNDFVFRALAKQTKGNAAIAPGGPLAALAALGAAENPLPELAQKRLGGSPDAAAKLLQALDRAEQGLRQTMVLRHTRSAWLSEPAPVEPSVLAVRPVSEGRSGLRAFMANAALPKEEDKPSSKPAGLASITAFEAVGLGTITALPKEQSIKFNDKPVDTLWTSATGYQSDEIAETVTIPLTQETHVLVITLPKDGAKLNELMTEVGSRVELAMAEPPRLAHVTFPRIVTATEVDAAEALGLAAANVTAESRTFVTIGNKPPVLTKGNQGGGGGGGARLPIWRPERFTFPTMPGRQSGNSSTKPIEIPNVTVDRPFAYAVVEKKSRTVILAGIVRELESNEKPASGK